MSIFTRRHYVWLASAMRDFREQRKTFSADFIDALASALEGESPEGFHREQFLHNIYCDPTDHAFGDDCKFTKS